MRLWGGLRCLCRRLTTWLGPILLPLPLLLPLLLLRSMPLQHISPSMNNSVMAQALVKLLDWTPHKPCQSSCLHTLGTSSQVVQGRPKAGKMICCTTTSFACRTAVKNTQQMRHPRGTCQVCLHPPTSALPPLPLLD